MKIERNLKRGMEGDDVKRLQEELKKAGYDPGPVDGKFGEKTEKAVKKFQKDKGLKEDGVVGTKTAKALNDAVDGGPSAAVGPAVDVPAQKALIDVIEKINEMLKKLEEKLDEKQKEKFEKLEKRKADLLLKKLEKDLDELEQQVGGDGEEGADESGSIISPEDKAGWNNERNVEDLARVIMSEASVGNQAERTAVGYTVLNRMKRNGQASVRGVWDAFAHNQDPTDEIRNLARRILRCEVPDNSGGATHFYSPQSMPREGEDTGGFDVGGGAEQTPGLRRRNYKPGWANRFPRVQVDGARARKFKFYRQPGSGRVR